MAFWDGLFPNTGKKNSFRDNLKALKYLLPLFKLIYKTHKFLTISNISLRLLKAVLPSATLLVGKMILDAIITSIQQKAPIKELWMLVAVELALVLFNDVLNRLITLADALLGDLFGNETSITLIQHAAELDLSQFEDNQFYDKMERARRQTTNRVVLMTQGLSQFQDIITVVMLISGLIYLQPLLVILLLISVIPFFISELFFSQQSYSLARSWTPERRELDYLRYIGASNETAKEIKIFGLENFIIRRFSVLANKYFLANKKLAVQRTNWGILLNILGEAAYYFAYVFIIQKTILGIITIGSLTFLSGSFARLRLLMQAIFSRFSSIAESAMYVQDYFDFLAIEPNIKNIDQPLPFPETLKEGFVFEKVGFKYPGTDIWAIRDVSFQLHPGEKIALVGENGAGKTTLVKLLSRMYEPTEGNIYLEGKNLKAYNLQDLRRHIGVIFQDFVKFYFNAKENIAIGNIEELDNMALIEQAAQQSLATEVVSQLPQHYQQMLGTRFAGGVELSGGQWQKIALARAYMRDAHLLILDEPTAALDARAEFEAFQRFTQLTQGKMAVLISHRFSTVRMADRILVLKQGKLEEIGTHEALLEKNGLYAELFHLQAKGYL